MNFNTLKTIKFIGNDGEIEEYQEQKMLNFLKSLGISDSNSQTLIAEFCEEINEYVRASEVIKTLERVAARKISPSTAIWEEVAARLFFAAILNRDYRGVYPTLENLKENERVDRRFLDMFTPEQIAELDSYIKPERDQLFNYKSAVIFHGKYCHLLNNHSTKREMPQIAYMRVAMFLGQAQGVEVIKDIYDAISTHQFTLATPIMVNAMTARPQTSSCVLMTVDDSTDSLLDINTKIGTMSARLAGTACNVQKLRAKGAPIINGKTSGPIPFIKVFESTISAWNQGGTRPGALAIYFSWWHSDVIDLLSLRSNGGTDENRARRLKYALKINDYLIDAVMNNEEVALVSPHEAPELYGLYGEEFNKAYSKYLNNPKTFKIPAREIWKKMFKERSETGNIYLFHEENVNNVSMLNRYIGSSNLCTEVVLPTEPSIDVVDVGFEKVA